MTENALHRFLVKRVIAIFVVLVIINLIFFSQRFVITAGLVCGTFVGIWKFCSTSQVLLELLSEKVNDFGQVRLIIRYTLGQVVTIVLLALSIKLNMWFFLGSTTGVLLITFVIFINSITEALGISHNNFQ